MLKYLIRTFILLTFMGMTVVCEVAAQHSKCGTIVTPAEVAKQMEQPGFGEMKTLFAPNKCFGKTLSITAHIIADSLGNYGITPVDITNSLSALNAAFAPICIDFELCKVNYIPNYKYNFFLKPTEEAELISLYAIPKTINIFYSICISTSKSISL